MIPDSFAGVYFLATTGVSASTLIGWITGPLGAIICLAIVLFFTFQKLNKVEAKYDEKINELIDVLKEKNEEKKHKRN